MRNGLAPSISRRSAISSKTAAISALCTGILCPPPRHTTIRGRPARALSPFFLRRPFLDQPDHRSFGSLPFLLQPQLFEPLRLDLWQILKGHSLLHCTPSRNFI